MIVQYVISLHDQTSTRTAEARITQACYLQSFIPHYTIFSGLSQFSMSHFRKFKSNLLSFRRVPSV